MSEAQESKEVVKPMQVTLREAFGHVEDAMFVKIVPFIRSSPGIGKSALVFQLAEKHNLLVIDLRLSYCDPTDLAGFPWLDPVTKTASYLPMDTFPLQNTPLPINQATGKAYSGWVLFLDEFNSAPMSVQAASYKLVLDRMAGMHKLHDRVVIICAGNLDDDGAITNPLSSASVSRVCHLEIKPSLKCWIDWADRVGITSVLTSFLEYRGGCFYTFNKEHPDQVYSCPRTLEFADRLLKRYGETAGKAKGEVAFPIDKMPLMAGTISEAVAKELYNFVVYQKDLPNLAEIVKRPKEVDVPTTPGIRYALSGALADYANMENIGAIIQYVERMPVEIQIVTLRAIIRRKKELVGNPALTKWATDNADQFF